MVAFEIIQGRFPMRILFIFCLFFYSFCAHAVEYEKPVLRAMSFSSDTDANGPSNADKVDINKADARELSERLKGIGEKKAQAIVSYRKEHGAFRSLHDLEKVKGIGPVLLKKNRHLIVLTDK